MDIYWIEDKKKMGPAPEVVVITKIENEELTPETLGWHKGCEGWIPLRELPALSSFFLPRHDEDEFEQVQNEVPVGAMPAEAVVIPLTVGMPPSWPLRILARVFDLFLYFLWMVLFIRLFELSFAKVMVNPYFDVGIKLGYIFYEMAWIQFFGTTPGKFLLKIRVVSMDFRRLDLKVCSTTGEESSLEGKHKSFESLSWRQSFWRSWNVMFFGMGFLMPIFLPVALLYTWLIYKQQRVTKWEQSSQTRLVGGKVNELNFFAVFLLFFVLLNLIGYLASPWADEIMEIMKTLQK